MAWNSVTGKDDTQLLLEQQGFENPVTETMASEPDVDGFLKAIEQIESSGGKNFDHKTMEAGIHAGHSAMGRFGLMPNTLHELATRAKREGTLNDRMREVSSISDPVLLKEHIEKNPEVERMFAEQLARRLLKKFPDEEQAAFSWNQGHNLTPESVQERQYKDHEYVKKFNKLRQLFLAGK